MSCEKDKVRNPKTKRCINIGGSAFIALLKDKTTVFDKEDVEKIRKAGYPIADPKPAMGMDPSRGGPESSGLEKTESPKKNTVKKIEKHVKKSPSPKYDLHYIDDGHSDYCRNGNGFSDQLAVPLISQSQTYKIPYSVCDMRTHYNFFPYLEAKKLHYKKSFHKEITMKYNNYNKEASLRLFKDGEIDIDFLWFKEVDDYLKSLSTYDAFTVLGYSYHSHNYINRYLNGEMTHEYIKTKLKDTDVVGKRNYFPFYVQSFKLLNSAEFTTTSKVGSKDAKTMAEWVNQIQKEGLQKGYDTFLSVATYFKYSWWEKVMKLFKVDFKRIINGAPLVRRPTVVYRGVNTDYFLKGASGNYYHNKCFVSCSLSPNHALLYLRGNKCCFKRITLLPGTRALFISGLSCYPDELEFVINVDSTLYIQETFDTKLYSNEYSILTDLCFKTAKTEVKISEIVVGP